MSRLFQITHEDIEQLNDSQLTDLLRRLLHLEAARSGIAARSVSVALNIDVPDGGEDGRIQWKKGPKNTDYIPSRLPMFPNKARDMGPKACADEMHQEHSVRLKPRIEEVLDSGGSYVLFATQSLNGRQIADRLKAMREAIRDAGKSYASQADLRIYDANLIRDWTNHYIPAISLGGAEFQGSGPALQDWQPRIPKDLQKVFNYFDEVLGRLTTVALGRGEVAEQSRNAITGHIRGLVRYGRIDALDPPITAIVDNQGSYWPKALEQVRQTIRYDGSNIPQTALQQLYRWEELLQPRSIPERLRIIVSTPPWRDIERDKNTRFLNRGEERAQALAEECARDPRPWMEHLPVLLQGEQRQGLAFGRRLGQCIDEPEPFISEALRVLASLNRGNGNPLVLAAFFGSIKENHQELVERTLDIVAHEQSLSPYLVELTRLLKPELPDLHRVLRLVQTKRIPVSDLKMFSYGSVLNHLTSTDFINFIDALLTYGGPGVWVALDILMLHRHDRRADWTTWKPQFRKILMHPELSFVDPTTLTDFSSWQDVAAKLLEEGDTELARNIAQTMLVACTSEHFYFEFDNAFQPVMRCLLIRYTNTVWPLLSDPLLSDDVRIVEHLTDLLSHRIENVEGTGLLSSWPEGILLEWCQQHPIKAPSMLARIMPLFLRQGEQWTWTPLIRAVIDRYGAQQAVLSAFTANLGTYSWSGSLVPYYERQVHPLEQLRHHHIPEVRRWAGEQLRYVQQQIGRESTHDAERELGIYWGENL